MQVSAFVKARYANLGVNMLTVGYTVYYNVSILSMAG